MKARGPFPISTCSRSLGGGSSSGLGHPLPFALSPWTPAGGSWGDPAVLAKGCQSSARPHGLWPRGRSSLALPGEQQRAIYLPREQEAPARPPGRQARDVFQVLCELEHRRGQELGASSLCRHAEVSRGVWEWGECQGAGSWGQ